MRKWRYNDYGFLIYEWYVYFLHIPLFFGNDKYVLYICLMKKKSDILLSRLKSSFRLVKYEQIKKRSSLTNIGDDELVLIKRGGSQCEVYLQVNRYSLRISPSLHKQYFKDMSEPYFRKHLKVFLEQQTGQDYGSSRFTNYDFYMYQNISQSISVYDFGDPLSRQKRTLLGAKMKVVWNDHSKSFGRNPKIRGRKQHNHLKVVSQTRPPI